MSLFSDIERVINDFIGRFMAYFYRGHQQCYSHEEAVVLLLMQENISFDYANLCRDTAPSLTGKYRRKKEKKKKKGLAAR